MIPGLIRISARDLIRRCPISSTTSSSSAWHVNRDRLNEEIRSLIQHRVSKLRDVSLDPTAYNLLINTPEFSRFIFVVPGLFMFGMSVVSLSGPSTMPLIFEKMIPYHIKTISIASAFYAFTDLAANAIGRPTATSHHRWKKSLFMVYAGTCLAASSAVMSLGDYDPHEAYKASLGLLLAHTLPMMFFPMQPWIKVWRLGFVSLGVLSVVGAELKLRYLEANWDDVVFLSQ